MRAQELMRLLTPRDTGISDLAQTQSNFRGGLNIRGEGTNKTIVPFEERASLIRGDIGSQVKSPNAPDSTNVFIKHLEALSKEKYLYRKQLSPWI